MTRAPDAASPVGDPPDPHRAATLLAVDAMLASTTLPPGAHRVESSPTSAVDAVGQTHSPNLISAVQWWTIAEAGKKVGTA